MRPDINLKGYYLHFISSANADIVKYNEYITDNKDLIRDRFAIDLCNYETEWIENRYNTKESLYTRTIKTIGALDDSESKVILYQVVKYCNVIKNIDKCYKLIELAKTRKSMKYGAYSKMVTDYYNKVHKVVLQGMGYRYLAGIGTYCINYWKIDPDKQKLKKRIDFAATNARKKELIARGDKIYDEKLAAWYKARNIPYDAVDYRVYKQESHFYDFTFIKAKFYTSGSVDYKRTEYVATKYRGMSYTDMADKLCKTFDDICNLQVDIRYKLNILLHKDPTKYLNFIRNDEQHKYKRGAHNW